MDKDYTILKDEVYLHLLAFYNNQVSPNFTAIGKEIGMTRQTISKHFDSLIIKGLICMNNSILKVMNPLEIDINKLRKLLLNNITNPIALCKELFFGDALSIQTLAKITDTPRSSYYNSVKESKDGMVIVYGIVHEGKLKYIGSTKNYQSRIAQHINNRTFLTKDNFIIIKEVPFNTQFNVELDLIHTLQPEWNTIGKEKNK